MRRGRAFPTGLVLAGASLSMLVYFYYVAIHVNLMPPVLWRLEGVRAAVAAVLIGYPAALLLDGLRPGVRHLLSRLAPNWPKVGFAVFLAALTPLAHFLWIPLPLGLFWILTAASVLHGNLSQLGFIAAVTAVVLSMTYLLTCLGWTDDTSGRLPRAACLFLWVVYAGEVLLGGFQPL